LLTVEVDALLGLPLEVEVLLLLLVVVVVVVVRTLLLVVASVEVVVLVVPLLLSLGLTLPGRQRCGLLGDGARLLYAHALGRRGWGAVGVALLGWGASRLALRVLPSLEGGVSGRRNGGCGVDGLVIAQGGDEGGGIGHWGLRLLNRCLRTCSWGLLLGLLTGGLLLGLLLTLLGLLGADRGLLGLLLLLLTDGGLLGHGGRLGSVLHVVGTGATLLLAAHQLLSGTGGLGGYGAGFFFVVTSAVNVRAGRGAEDLGVGRRLRALGHDAGRDAFRRALQDVVGGGATPYSEQIERLAVVQRGRFAVNVEPVGADLVLLVKHGVVRTQEPEVLHRLQTNGEKCVQRSSFYQNITVELALGACGCYGYLIYLHKYCILFFHITLVAISAAQ